MQHVIASKIWVLICDHLRLDLRNLREQKSAMKVIKYREEVPADYADQDANDRR